MCSKLICRHEPLLSNTTNADEKFPDRKRKYIIDGEEFEGVFSVDLTLAEVKTLRARQPSKKRDPSFNDLYQVRRTFLWSVCMASSSYTVLQEA
jgi:glycerophosphoryl diester phosphodiesterase